MTWVAFEDMPEADAVPDLVGDRALNVVPACHTNTPTVPGTGRTPLREACRKLPAQTDITVHHPVEAARPSDLLARHAIAVVRHPISNIDPKSSVKTPSYSQPPAVSSKLALAMPS
ncbi:MAG: hypothetical protein OXG37_05785 [Actinomycetia bacterium]|nr:hypothetical protein [Actinomycetes bacterium]